MTDILDMLIIQDLAACTMITHSKKHKHYSKGRHTQELCKGRKKRAESLLGGSGGENVTLLGGLGGLGPQYLLKHVCLLLNSPKVRDRERER